MKTVPIIAKIDEFRRKRKISKDALEKRAGLSSGRMCKWVAGQGSPNADQILRIADVLGVHPMELMTNSKVPGVHCRMWRPMSQDERREVMGVCERMGYTEVMHRLLSPVVPTKKRGGSQEKDLDPLPLFVQKVV